MVDLHTHILPNMDDGAKDIQEAIKMTEVLLKQKVITAVCTPHYDPTKTSIQEFTNKREIAMNKLKGSKITLLKGSETVLHDYLFHYPDLSDLCIGTTKYLLIELPFNKNWNESIYEQLERLINFYGIIPVIAHIERYPVIKKNMKCLKILIDLGCVIQLNTSTIINKKSRKKALQYMKRGYIDVLGSDCHNMFSRPPKITEAFDIVTHELGSFSSNKLLHNAECIVHGIEIKKQNAYIIQ